MGGEREKLDEETTKCEIVRLQPKYRFRTDRPTVIGTGGFGSVYLAQEVLPNDRVRDVAIKVVGDDVLRHAGRRIVNELMLLRQLRHDNIVALLNVFTDAPASDPLSFKAVFLVFEWVQHDLRGIIYHRPRILLPNHVSWIMYQLFLALHFMHSCGVAHRDVTPTNILVNPTGTEVKVIDLGLSRVAAPDPSKMTSYVTQRWYRAPEVVMSVGHDLKIDMWSAGTVLAEMLRNEPLFRLQSSRARTEPEVRSLRTQQLVRLLVVIGPPDEQDIKSIRHESVSNWLRVYRDKVMRRTAVVEDLARQVLVEGFPRGDSVQSATAEEAIKRVRDILGMISASQREAPETKRRIAEAVGILTAARERYGQAEAARLGSPTEDIIKILPHFTGGKSSLRQELPRDVDPRALDLLTQLLQVTPGRRPTARAALQHEYVCEWFDSSDLERIAPRGVVDSYTVAAGQTGPYDYRRGICDEVVLCQAAVAANPMGEPSAPPPAAAVATGTTSAGGIASTPPNPSAGVPRPPPGGYPMDVDDGSVARLP